MLYCCATTTTMITYLTKSLFQTELSSAMARSLWQVLLSLEMEYMITALHIRAKQRALTKGFDRWAIGLGAGKTGTNPFCEGGQCRTAFNFPRPRLAGDTGAGQGPARIYRVEKSDLCLANYPRRVIRTTLSLPWQWICTFWRRICTLFARQDGARWRKITSNSSKGLAPPQASPTTLSGPKY